MQPSNTKADSKVSKGSEAAKKSKPKKEKKAAKKSQQPKVDLEEIFSEFGVEIDEEQIQKENELKKAKSAKKTPRNSKKEGGKNFVPVSKITGGGVPIKKKAAGNKSNEPEALAIAALEEIFSEDKKKKKKDKSKFNQAPTR
mmetsp:Transcript_14972/g.21256  ORF Transcript_14972/g.21256 Transcript_14972/m.21256 type:complete len:142 (-) Transcript_14972:122-547(-)